MCSKKPKVPDNTQETPAVLMTAREGSATPEVNSTGRRKLRIDLNDSTSVPTTGYGSALVIPN
ncbi:hypothetical protein [Luteibacter sp. 22Crub2.1]|jgi:hypothetical protein|uniref:hypothetical protein n=1 Tax=Luteibacter sp. 22Crub2.1 TaxID=1283288 RepID=UPI0009A64515|nr:hypothetical protein [Luteibacter sp. 22Crub2.1]SKB50608.1 hypothetical protein SAMN05660880_01362 [Luteibacter sp. 22Crub2.1]